MACQPQGFRVLLLKILLLMSNCFINYQNQLLLIYQAHIRESSDNTQTYPQF